jgi:hypothetical protein
VLSSQLMSSACRPPTLEKSNWLLQSSSTPTVLAFACSQARPSLSVSRRSFRTFAD